MPEAGTQLDALPFIESLRFIGSARKAVHVAGSLTANNFKTGRRTFTDSTAKAGYTVLALHSLLSQDRHKKEPCQGILVPKIKNPRDTPFLISVSADVLLYKTIETMQERPSSF